jgi:hypothetical protein
MVKKAAARKPTAWNKHVATVHKANPKMKFSEVLKKAKKTYTK